MNLDASCRGLGGRICSGTADSLLLGNFLASVWDFGVAADLMQVAFPQSEEFGMGFSVG